MIRIRIQDGATDVPVGCQEISGFTVRDLDGPLELSAWEFRLSGEWVSQGEWLWTGTEWIMTAPHVAEFYLSFFLLIPLGLLAGFISLMRALNR